MTPRPGALRRAAAALLLCALAGCSSLDVEVPLRAAPQLPLRVAVLPFVDQAEGDFVLSAPVTRGLDLLPLLGDDALTRRYAATLLRSWFVTNLDATHHEVLPPLAVDAALERAEVDVIDAYRGDRAEAARRIAEATGADAVAFGEVTEWERSYYLVESVLEVGFALELRGADGEVLYAGHAEEIEDWGLSKVPLIASVVLGLSPFTWVSASAVVGRALLALRNVQFVPMSHLVSRRALMPLVPGRDDPLETRAPRLLMASHSGLRPLEAGETLAVVALGDAGCRATFRLGDGPDVPMNETAPGRYQGALPLGSAHRFAGAKLTVRLVSRELRATRATLADPVWTAEAWAALR